MAPSYTSIPRACNHAPVLPPDEQLASLPYLHASPGTDEVEGEGAATIKTADGRDVLRGRAPREALFESTSMEQVPMVSGELTNCVCRVKQISIFALSPRVSFVFCGLRVTVRIEICRRGIVRTVHTQGRPRVVIVFLLPTARDFRHPRRVSKQSSTTIVT